MNLDLFDEPSVSRQRQVPRTRPLPPSQRSSEESRAAADRAVAFRPMQLTRVLTWLIARKGDGGTQRECAAALGIERQSLAARFWELENANAIYKSQPKQIRQAGRVYFATEEAC